MRVGDLVSHLLKLDQDAEIRPIWEGHCPGDFGGLERDGEWVDHKYETGSGYWLICEELGSDPVWTIEPEDSP